jgi:hypothetical protein
MAVSLGIMFLESTNLERFGTVIVADDKVDNTYFIMVNLSNIYPRMDQIFLPPKLYEKVTLPSN